MSQFKAEELVIQIEDSAGADTFSEIDGITECGMNDDRAGTDVSRKTSSGNREMLAFGQKTTDVSFSGIVADDTETAALLDAAGTIPLVQFKIISAEGTTWTGFFMVHLERSGGQNDAEVFSGSLESTGAIVRT